MSPRKVLMWLIFIGMMIPPIVWVFLLAFSHLFSIDELISILFSIPMALYMEEDSPVILAITAAITVVFVFKKLLTRRSEEGVRVFAQIEGLRMFLETSERERLQMFNPPEDTPELFETLLPYALALGAARTWANRFADVLERAGYAPSWYSGSMPTGAFNAGFASSFASDLSGSIASSSTAPGSSSGSEGSSGGGGGGGGGGGW